MMEERVKFFNNKKEKLVGILHKGKSKYLIIICHGYKISKDYPAIKYTANELHERGFSVLRFDFSGCGESEGSPALDLAQQILDVRSAIESFRNFDKIVLVGGSLGGFVAAIASTRYKKVSKLITINGFFYPRKLGLKYSWYRLFNPQLRVAFNYIERTFKPQLISVPVLVIHDKDDKVVDFTNSTEFYNALESKSQFVTIDTNDHELTKREYPEIIEAITKWISAKPPLKKKAKL